MMNQLKKLMLFVLLILLIQLKKLTITHKLKKIKRKILIIIISTQEFNNLTSEDFAAILAQVSLASKNDISDFVKIDRF